MVYNIFFTNIALRSLNFFFLFISINLLSTIIFDNQLYCQNKLIEYVIPQPQQDDYVFKGRKKGQHLNRKSVDRVVRRTLKELSIKGASLHSTRRTCLTTLKDKGWQTSDIMAVSGHKDLNSLEKYLHTTPKQMKKMVNDFD